MPGASARSKAADHRPNLIPSAPQVLAPRLRVELFAPGAETNLEATEASRQEQERLEALARRAKSLDALSAGEREVAEGKVHPWEEVKAELASWQR